MTRALVGLRTAFEISSSASGAAMLPLVTTGRNSVASGFLRLHVEVVFTRVAARRFGDLRPGRCPPIPAVRRPRLQFGFVAEADLGQVAREDLFAEDQFRFFDVRDDHEGADRADFDFVRDDGRFAVGLPVDRAFVERRRERFGRQFEFRAAQGVRAFDRFRFAFARFAEAGRAELAGGRFTLGAGGEVDRVVFRRRRGWADRTTGTGGGGITSSSPPSSPSSSSSSGSSVLRFLLLRSVRPLRRRTAGRRRSPSAVRRSLRPPPLQPGLCGSIGGPVAGEAPRRRPRGRGPRAHPRRSERDKAPGGAAKVSHYEKIMRLTTRFNRKVELWNEKRTGWGSRRSCPVRGAKSRRRGQDLSVWGRMGRRRCPGSRRRSGSARRSPSGRRPRSRSARRRSRRRHFPVRVVEADAAQVGGRRGPEVAAEGELDSAVGDVGGGGDLGDADVEVGVRVDEADRPAQGPGGAGGGRFGPGEGEWGGGGKGFQQQAGEDPVRGADQERGFGRLRFAEDSVEVGLRRLPCPHLAAADRVDREEVRQLLGSRLVPGGLADRGGADRDDVLAEVVGFGGEFDPGHAAEREFARGHVLLVLPPQYPEAAAADVGDVIDVLRQKGGDEPRCHPHPVELEGAGVEAFVGELEGTRGRPGPRQAAST